MSSEWSALSALTKDRSFTVERVKLDNGIAIDGSFELPPLARLAAEDQVFVAAFVRCHGSIKQMEAFFGVSYPTIKNRLNRLSEQLPFPEVRPPARQSLGDLLSQIERGEITAVDAINQLRSDDADDK
jgi:hypothetical protein